MSFDTPSNTSAPSLPMARQAPKGMPSGPGDELLDSLIADRMSEIPTDQSQHRRESRPRGARRRCKGRSGAEPPCVPSSRASVGSGSEVSHLSRRSPSIGLLLKTPRQCRQSAAAISAGSAVTEPSS
eukprot:857842-Pyramimonas_sp.AAC.1